MEAAASKYVAEHLSAFMQGFRKRAKGHKEHCFGCAVLLLLHMCLALNSGGKLSLGSLANGFVFLQW